MLPRGVILGLRATIVVMSLGVTGCHAKPGTLPVDSPIYAFRAPDPDDDDTDDTDTTETSAGSGAAEGSGAGSAKEK